MNMDHYNELAELSRKVYDQAADSITGYCAARYCAVGNDTAEQQMEDYLFVARETSLFLLGNALALLAPESREEEIRGFTEDLRRVIRYAQQKAAGRGEPG